MNCYQGNCNDLFVTEFLKSFFQSKLSDFLYGTVAFLGSSAAPYRVGWGGNIR